ncbi:MULTISPECIES: hypothetical protein [unclassified Corynebacterium]|uniref:hypothetical protein n=1 Tax=unclassified Corynebacterium TaxID=2624378 RepID=UPI0029C9C359|nr:MULTISPECIES: hypothetical protein [unclassified Corynebacterium]WPF65206.1 hypothetical protein OLX12_06305 [Corynebacterium sp. 22KM0430]WPF67701.1 hypothetical protein OLW90_06295 [Corynebacterium sp. 21KM1197]
MGGWIALAVLLTLILAWAYFTAQRLNRLHIRTDSALQNLQASLDRRASLVEALVPAAAPQARELLGADYSVRALDRRALAEARLEESLGTMEHLPAQVVDASARVELARRFYNDAVTDTRALRTRPLVRALRLGGTAPLPVYFELVHSPEA